MSDPIVITEEQFAMVRTIARTLAARVSFRVSVDELSSAGFVGLIDAISRHDRAQDDKFESYLHLRVRGAMVDELRTRDWMRRAHRRFSKRMASAERELTAQLGRHPDESEIAARVGMPVDQFRAWVSRAQLGKVVGGDEVIDELQAETETADDRAYRLERHTQIERAKRVLTPRRRQIVDLYFYAGQTLQEIADGIGITESAACQILRQALADLREAVGEERWPAKMQKPRAKTKKAKTMLTPAIRKAFAALARVACEEIVKGMTPRTILDREGSSVYLERYYLHGAPTAEGEWSDSPIGIYLHRFRRSDDDLELHNHPWESAVSFVLTGGYEEERRVDHADGKSSVERRRLEPFSFNVILADTFHRVELLEDDAWTLFIVTRKTQSWGFWNRISGVYMPWREFIARKRGVAPELVTKDVHKSEDIRRSA